MWLILEMDKSNLFWGTSIKISKFKVVIQILFLIDYLILKNGNSNYLI